MQDRLPSSLFSTEASPEAGAGETMITQGQGMPPGEGTACVLDMGL